MKEVLVLRDLECIKAIAHPKRIEILKMFHEAPLSAKQLSQLLDEPHAKINYHIKTLYKVGILDLVEEKIKSGIVEKYYYPTAKNIVIGKKVLNFYLDDGCEDEEISISRFEDMSELFYKAMENDIFDQENLIDYSSISLTENEVKELNDSIKSKINEIVEKRNSESNELKYGITMLAIPVLKQKEVEVNV